MIICKSCIALALPNLCKPGPVDSVLVYSGCYIQARQHQLTGLQAVCAGSTFHARDVQDARCLAVLLHHPSHGVTFVLTVLFLFTRGPEVHWLATLQIEGA
jgi:hypothetical protein